MKNIQLSGALPVTGILMVTYGYNYGKKTSGLILFSWIVYKITLETGCITGNGNTSGLIPGLMISPHPIDDGSRGWGDEDARGGRCEDWDGPTTTTGHTKHLGNMW